MDNIADRCLICYSIVTSTVANKKRKYGKRGGERLSSSSVLLQQLDNIFILKELLEIPSHNLETFLKDCGKPEMWISICPNCEGLIEEAKRINNEMIEVRKRFNSVKKQVIEAIQKSNAKQDVKADLKSRKRKLPTRITDQSRSFVNIHNYGDFTDPFISGDKRASQLIKKNRSNYFANKNKKAAEVKAELKSNDCQVHCRDETKGRFFNLETNSYEYYNNETDKIHTPIKDNSKIRTPIQNDCTYSTITRNEIGSEKEMDADHDDWNSDTEDQLKKSRGKNTREGKFVDSKTCGICFKTFASRSAKSYHQSSHLSGGFPCHYCSKIFQRRFDCKRHMQSIHKEQENHDRQASESKKNLSCPVCNIFKAADVEELIIHWKSCEGIAAAAIEDNMNCDKVVTCQICNSFKSSLSEQLEFFEHLLICKSKENLTTGQPIPLSCRIFECNICPPKTYFTLDGFIQHFVEHNRNIYKCTKCPQRYPVISQIHLHWKSDHQDAVKNVKPSCRFSIDKSVPQICWWCHVCNQKFPNEDLRAEHIASAHESDVPEKLHICQQCSKAYSCQAELKLHEGTEHVKVTTNVSVFECDVCKMRFATSNQLKNHRMAKHRLDLLVCDVCGKECNSANNLKNHMQLHADVKEFACQQCDKSFTTAQYLRNHKFQVHTPHDAQINPLVCKYCHKAFYSKSYLNQHIAGTHEGRFTIFCNLCPAGFFHNSQFKKHLAKKHKIGEIKIYSCTVGGCDKKFDSRKALREHIDRHTGNPQYKCQFCPKEFYDSTHLLRHEQIHINSELKPYVCEICPKRFPVRDYLYLHMKSHKMENK